MLSLIVAMVLAGQAPMVEEMESVVPIRSVTDRLTGMEKAMLVAEAEQAAERYKNYSNAKRRILVKQDLIRWFTSPLTDREENFINTKTDLACEPYDIVEARTGVYLHGAAGSETQEKTWYDTEIRGQRVKVWGYRSRPGKIMINMAEQTGEVQRLLSPPAPIQLQSPPVRMVYPQSRPMPQRQVGISISGRGIAGCDT